MLRYHIIILMLVALMSCNNPVQERNVFTATGNDEMVEVNRFLVQKDNERISSFINRKGLTMSQTGSGLWFGITKEGSGGFFEEGSKVSYEYETNLLDGTLCYTSAITGPKDVVIGHSEIESGLNEGLKLLKPGSEAIFILQPYLAYGLLGDGNKIPARSVIVVKVKILNK